MTAQDRTSEDRPGGRLGLGRLELGRLGPRLSNLGYARALGLITAFGALLRLALLARQPLGYDEDFTNAVVVRPFGQMLDAVGRDIAPPLFYLLEWPAQRLIPGPAGLRLVPALAGIALIPLLATLARRAAGDAAALWTAAFVAVVPATVLSSENARMYTLAGSLVVAAMLFLWHALETPLTETTRGRLAWLGFGLCGAAAVWSDYFAAIALAGIVLGSLWLRPPNRSFALTASIAAVAVASIGVWFLLAPTQLGHAGQGFWIPPLSPGSVGGTLGQLFAGPPVDDGVPGRELLLGFQAVAALSGAIALIATWFAVRRAARSTRVAAVFLLLACSGVVALVVVSLWRPILEARYASVMWLPLFALAGLGLAALPRQAAVALLGLVLVVSLSVGGVATTHPETSSLVPEIESRLQPGDVVVADPDHYLVLLANGSPELRASLHVLSAQDPAWYFGTAAYPPDAVIHDLAAAGRSRATVFWVGDPRASLPELPAGYVASGHCLIRACLVIFEPGG